MLKHGRDSHNSKHTTESEEFPSSREQCNAMGLHSFSQDSSYERVFFKGKANNEVCLLPMGSFLKFLDAMADVVCEDDAFVPLFTNRTAFAATRFGKLNRWIPNWLNHLLTSYCS